MSCSIHDSGPVNIRAPRKKLEYNPPNYVMTPETVLPAAPEPASMGAASRVAGVFFEPKKTFEDIARRPTVLFPLIVVILIGVLASFVIARHVDFATIIRQQMESNSRLQQLPAEQREQQIQMWTKLGPVFAYVAAVVWPPLRALIVAAVLMLTAAVLMSAPIKFKQMYSLVCFAWMPAIVYSVLLVVVAYLKPPDEFNPQNPLALNPAAFLDPNTTSKFLYSFASYFDLINFWYIFLLATGIKAAAGKKFAFSNALWAVLLPWIVMVLAGSAWAGIFS